MSAVIYAVDEDKTEVKEPGLFEKLPWLKYFLIALGAILLSLLFGGLMYKIFMPSKNQMRRAEAQRDMYPRMFGDDLDPSSSPYNA
jgi:hypothetical protein